MSFFQYFMETPGATDKAFSHWNKDNSAHSPFTSLTLIFSFFASLSFSDIKQKETRLWQHKLQVKNGFDWTCETTMKLLDICSLFQLLLCAAPSHTGQSLFIFFYLWVSLAGSLVSTTTSQALLQASMEKLRPDVSNISVLMTAGWEPLYLV